MSMLNGKIVRTYGAVRYRTEDVQNAGSVSELTRFLCPRAGGDATTCVSCRDMCCEVGKRVRDLMEAETAPTVKEPEKKPPGPDYELVQAAVKSSQPITYLIRNYFLLSSKPIRFSRKDAVRLLKDYAEQNTDMAEGIENAIAEEERQDYRRSLSAIDDATFRQSIARKYAIRNNEALTYINGLREKYSGEPRMPTRKPDRTEPDILTADRIQEQYERLFAKKEDLDSQYEGRLEKIDEEIRVIEKAIETYTAMIKTIQETEKALEFLPEIQPLPTETSEEEEWEDGDDT